MTIHKQFDAPAFAITKSYRNEHGAMFIEGMASTIDVDQQGERMSPQAIAKMAARLVGKPLRSEHGKGWDDKLGEIVKADVINDEQNRPALWIKAKLFDWSSKAKDLFSLLQSGSEMGMSVAGAVNPGGLIKEFVESVGKFIPTYIDIEPAEVSITDHPANLATFAYAVSKSLKEQSEVTKSGLSDADEVIKTEAADGKLLAFQRFFNQQGQRAKMNKSVEEWEAIGSKLAQALSLQTSQQFTYTNEQVVNSNLISKEDTMSTQLTSKSMPSDVSQFITQFQAKVPGVEVAKAAPAQVDEVEKTDTSTSTSTSTDSTTPSTTDSSTTTPSSSDSSSADSSTSTATTLDALMSDLETSLPTATADSMSSDSSDASSAKKADSVSSVPSSSSDSGMSSDIKDTSSMGGSSSSSASTDSSSPTDVSSMSKDADSYDGDDDAMLECAMEIAKLMRKFMSKGMKKAQPKNGNGTQDSSSLASSAGSSSGLSDDSRIGGSSSSSASSSMGLSKSTEEKLLNVLKAMKEENQALRKELGNVKEIVKSIPNERKSFAMPVEKNFSDATDAEVEKAKENATDLEKKLLADPEITHAELHQFRTFGVVPEKYAKKD